MWPRPRRVQGRTGLEVRASRSSRAEGLGAGPVSSPGVTETEGTRRAADLQPAMTRERAVSVAGSEACAWHLPVSVTPKLQRGPCKLPLGEAPASAMARLPLPPGGFSRTDFPHGVPGARVTLPPATADRYLTVSLTKPTNICGRSPSRLSGWDPRGLPSGKRIPRRSCSDPGRGPPHPGQGCRLFCPLLGPPCLEQRPTHSRHSGNYLLVLFWAGVSSP